MEKGNPYTLRVGLQIAIDIMENIQRFLKKLKVELPYDPVIPVLSFPIQRNWNKNLAEISVLSCSLQHYLQSSGYGNNLNVH